MGKDKGKKREREEEEVPSDFYPSDDSVADEDFSPACESESEKAESESEEGEDSDVQITGSSENNNNNNNNNNNSNSKSKEKGKGKKPKSKKKRKSNDSDDESDFEVPSISPMKSSSKKSKSSKKSNSKKKGKKAAKSPRSRRGQNDFIWDEHDADGLEETRYVPKEAPQPEGLRVTLLGFQRESLEWMTKQEKDPHAKGGILADDMGMGKTLQAISLLLTNRPDPESEHRTTLVVCPVVALVQWHTEILKYTKPGTLKIHLYHGPERLTDATEESKEALSEFDIVLTTYSIVEADFRYQKVGRKREGEFVKKLSLLHNMHWHRIILDEAHSIKDRASQTARAIFSLEGNLRWVLTGTPLQNRVGELYSLIRFLRLTPYSHYYCKKCDCKSLWWNFERKKIEEGENAKKTKKTGRDIATGARKCTSCGHSAMSHFAWWNRNVLNPILRTGMESTEGQMSMHNLRCILQKIMIRRTKQEKAEDLCLPPRIIKVRKVELDDEENDFYEALFGQSKTKFMGYVEQGTILNNYAHVFDLLLRLRQAVDHPYLVIHRAGGDSATGPGACALCYEPAEDPVKSQCDHIFCRTCVTQFLESNTDGDIDLGESSKKKKPVTSKLCPSCSKPLTINLNQDAYVPKKENSHKNILQRIDLDSWRSSSKVEALVEELTRARMKDPNAKSLVFSQFVNLLDLIEWRLRLSGFKCVKLDGRMNIQAKNIAIQKFHDDPDTCVFLISLKAGGMALNLTVASHCFLMDPWWNPAAEFQAIDRIYRLGQYKCISVTRFIVPNTIEDRIVRLQDKKSLIFQSTVGMDTDALSRLSVDDLKFLFN